MDEIFHFDEDHCFSENQDLMHIENTNSFSLEDQIWNESDSPSNVVLLKYIFKGETEYSLKERIVQHIVNTHFMSNFAAAELEIKIVSKIIPLFCLLMKVQDNAVLLFREETHAVNAISICKDLFGQENVSFGEVSAYINSVNSKSVPLSFMLEESLQLLNLVSSARLQPPKNAKQILTSPPPSPPTGWRPIREEINKIPYLDLSPVKIGNQEILLSGDHRLPTIIVSHM